MRDLPPDCWIKAAMIMAKKEKPAAPTIVPSKHQAIEPPVDPEDPMVPAADEVIPDDEASFESPPYEMPEPGEGP